MSLPYYSRFRERARLRDTPPTLEFRVIRQVKQKDSEELAQVLKVEDEYYNPNRGGWARVELQMVVGTFRAFKLKCWEKRENRECENNPKDTNNFQLKLDKRL